MASKTLKYGLMLGGAAVVVGALSQLKRRPFAQQDISGLGLAGLGYDSLDTVNVGGGVSVPQFPSSPPPGTTSTTDVTGGAFIPGRGATYTPPTEVTGTRLIATDIRTGRTVVGTVDSSQAQAMAEFNEWLDMPATRTLGGPTNREAVEECRDASRGNVIYNTVVPIDSLIKYTRAERDAALAQCRLARQRDAQSETTPLVPVPVKVPGYDEMAKPSAGLSPYVYWGLGAAAVVGVAWWAAQR